MNPLCTSQLIHALKRKLDKDFVTVCPVNELILDRKGIYVVNTDNHVGRHWVVIFVTEKTVEFYDSLGRHPKFLQNGPMFMQSIHRTGKNITSDIKNLSALYKSCLWILLFGLCFHKGEINICTKVL